MQKTPAPRRRPPQAAGPAGVSAGHTGGSRARDVAAERRGEPDRAVKCDLRDRDLREIAERRVRAGECDRCARVRDE